MADQRVASLDLIRGVAVLGILAINIAGFSGPSTGVISPNLPSPTGPWDEIAYAFSFVFFEGKMRTLFAILFGASMALFIDQSDKRGRDGDMLQAKRLTWLLLLGSLHYFLLWWGDILFAYAACGLFLLVIHRIPDRLLCTPTVAFFILHHAQGFFAAMPTVYAEELVRLGQATIDQAASVARYNTHFATAAKQEMDQYTGGFGHILETKISTHPFWLIRGAYDGFAEYLALMTIGLVLQRRGFFAGSWSLPTMLRIGLVFVVIGLGLTLCALAWLLPRHFPPIAMDAALRYGLALPHLCMAIGYAALLIPATRWILGTALGRRIDAAGRMAFSNYIGTTLVMTAIFYGWGLGLFGTVPPLSQWAFVILGWCLMLAFSTFWLERWRRGPLEWLWRSLTEMQFLPNKR